MRGYALSFVIFVVVTIASTFGLGFSKRSTGSQARPFSCISWGH